jgi:hypothetical protein
MDQMQLFWTIVAAICSSALIISVAAMINAFVATYIGDYIKNG